MRTKKLVLAMAVSAAAMAFAGSVSALTVSYSQHTGFLFNSLTPQNQNIARQGNDLGLTPPTSALTGRTYESLWWGEDVITREQNAFNTPIDTSGGPIVWNASAAAWTADGNPDSALKVLGLSGSISSVYSWVPVTDPAWQPISVVFHSNRTIRVNDTGLLTSGIVRANLSIGSMTDYHDTPFSFLETLNSDTAYTCPDGSGVSCDIFQFPLASFAPLKYVDPDTGNHYTIYFDFLSTSGAFVIDSTSTWGNGECQEGNFCVLTKEEDVNYLVTGMLMVPEPASLALVGMGLLGLAGLRRRKTA